MGRIKVLVNGAAGKMGREVVKAVSSDPELQLVGAVDVAEVGVDVGAGVKISKDLDGAIKAAKPDVVIDFTHPSVAMENVRVILKNKIHAVMGTTGVSKENLKEIEKLCRENNVNCLVAPNFAIGAVLMMQFARDAAKHLPNVEIIELHHDQKADAPSGTAIKTAEMIAEERGKRDQELGARGQGKEIEKIDGVRGGTMDGIHIHSVRLPGFVAHQEVIFGGLGQTLTIRHDTINRESFMPGVVMAAKKIGQKKGLTYGLEGIL